MIEIGQTHGCRTIVGGPANRSQKYPHVVSWQCQCICGDISWVEQRKITRGKSLKCRICCNKMYVVNERYLLPSERERLVSKISAIFHRCYNQESSGWSDYGGRGIKVCDEWVRDRTEFLLYLLTLAGWDNTELTLDRVDNDKGYEPGNLRFVSRSVQQHNRRITRESLRRHIGA